MGRPNGGEREDRVTTASSAPTAEPQSRALPTAGPCGKDRGTVADGYRIAMRRRIAVCPSPDGRGEVLAFTWRRGYEAVRARAKAGGRLEAKASDPVRGAGATFEAERTPVPGNWLPSVKDSTHRRTCRARVLVLA